jgi:DNA-binding PadR family transcriptional regulator
LAPAALHGYGIIQSVEALSAGRVRLRAGTLYTALDRMTGDCWLAVDREEVVSGRLRRYYRITEAGLAVLRTTVAELEADVSAVRVQLSHRGEVGLA